MNRFLTAKTVIAYIAVVIFVQLGITTAMAGDVLSIAKAKGAIVVGTSNEAPLSYIDSKTNLPAGALFDVIREFFRRQNLDVKLNVIVMPSGSLIPAIQSERIDLMGDAMWIKPARRKVIDFTDGIFFNPESLDVPKGNPRGLHKLADLCGHSVGTEQGTLYVDMLKTASDACPAGEKITVTLYPTFPNVFADLAAGRIDAGIVDATVAAYAIDQNPNLGFELVSDYVPVDRSHTLCAFIVQKGQNAEFLAAFNKSLSEMKADGTLAKIFEKSGLKPASYFLNP